MSTGPVGLKFRFNRSDNYLTNRGDWTLKKPVKILLILVFNIILSSCLSGGRADEESRIAVPSEPESPAPSKPSSLSLLDPSSSPGFISPTVRVEGVVSGQIIKLYKNIDCTDFVTEAIASSNSPPRADISTSDLETGTYTFYAKAFDSSGIGGECSTANVSYTVSSPPTPSLLSLASPVSSPAFDRNPLIRISGVQNGVSVHLYSDSGCTVEVNSVNASSTHVDVTAANLAIGSYDFYAKTSVGKNSSPCSTASINYDLWVPLEPSSITLVSPLSSPGIDPKPIVKIDGLAVNLTLTLYTDSLCTQVVDSKNVGGTSVEIEVPTALPLGVTSFYAQTENSDGDKGSCSTASLAYNLTKIFNEVDLALNGSMKYFTFGNVNNDGDLDIFSSNTFRGLSYLGAGAGNLSHAHTIQNLFSTTASGPLVLADFNGDGNDDLIAGEAYGKEVKYFASDGDGTFTSGTQISFPSGPTWAYYIRNLVAIDLDKDGNMDILTGNGTNGAGSVSTMLGNGNGTFQPLVHYSSDDSLFDIKTADFDGDTYPDAAVALKWSNEIGIYINNGDGTFAAKVDYPSGTSPKKIIVGDFDKDSDIDIISFNEDKSFYLSSNNGSGSFGGPLVRGSFPGSLTGVDSGDIDGDANIDIVVSSRSVLNGYITIFYGNGDGSFQTGQSLRKDYYFHGVKLMDIDGDSDLDIFVTPYGALNAAFKWLVND